MMMIFFSIPRWLFETLLFGEPLRSNPEERNQ